MLQAAIGPVFFFILNLTLQCSLLDGHAAVLAAVLVDYLYITLVVLGEGQLLKNEGGEAFSGNIWMADAQLGLEWWLGTRNN